MVDQMTTQIANFREYNLEMRFCTDSKILKKTILKKVFAQIANFREYNLEMRFCTDSKLLENTILK